MVCLTRCRKVTVGFVAGVLAVATCLALIFHSVRPTDPETIDPATIPRAAVEALFATHLPDLEGRSYLIGDWRDKTLVINFWASWCQPCREEMPAFARLQTKYAGQGVQLVGIAVDNAKSVAEFSEKLPVNYPLLIAETAGSELMRQLGNRQMGLPYTLVIRNGTNIGFVKLGRLPEKMLNEFLQANVIAGQDGRSGQRPAY